MNTTSNPSLFPLWELSLNGHVIRQGHDHDLDEARIYALMRPAFRYILELYSESGEVLATEIL